MLLLEHSTVKPTGQADVLACQACRYDDATPRVLHTQGAPPRDGPTQAVGRQDAEATQECFTTQRRPSSSRPAGEQNTGDLSGAAESADSACHPEGKQNVYPVNSFIVQQ